MAIKSKHRTLRPKARRKADLPGTGKRRKIVRVSRTPRGAPLPELVAAVPRGSQGHTVPDSKHPADSLDGALIKSASWLSDDVLLMILSPPAVEGVSLYTALQFSGESIHLDTQHYCFQAES